MKPADKQNRCTTKLTALKSQLRSMPDVEVPETLEAKLLADVPQDKCGHKLEMPRHGRTSVLGCSTAAAIVLSFVSIFSYYSNASIPDKRFIIDPKDISRFGVADSLDANFEQYMKVPGTNEPKY